MTVNVSRENAIYYLRAVEPKWKGFWLHMHLVAFGLEEFADGLTDISDEVFAYHFNPPKNDLAKWVREVVGDAELAQDLDGIKSKEEAVRLVRSRVEALKRAAKPSGS